MLMRAFNRIQSGLITPIAFAATAILLPTSAAAQIEMNIMASATTIEPKVELVIRGFVASAFDILDLPPVTLTRNGVDVSSWLNVSGNPYYNPAEAAGVVRAYRGTFSGLSAGNNTFVAKICHQDYPSSCAVDTVIVNYVGSGSYPTYAAPLAELAQGMESRYLDGCSGCASRTASYSTPAEFIMGGARSVMLNYSTEMAKPTAFIEVDAVVPSSTVPTALQLRVKRNGSFETLTTGGTYATVAGDTARVRLAAQFDASGLVTGGYMVEVHVQAFWDGVGTYYDTVYSRVLVQNETSSPYGVGWTVAGVARLHSQTDGVIFADGSGGIHFYPDVSACGSSSSCTYGNPTGTFSTLTKASASGPYNIVWTLTHRDGSAHRFTSDGLLKQVADRFGNSSRVDYQFPSSGPRVWKMISTVRTNGTSTDRTATFAYDSVSGKLASITMPDGRQSTFAVTSGNLVSVTDPDGVSALTAGYVSNRLVSLAGRNGAADTVLFDAFGQLAEHRTPSVLTETDGTVRISTMVASLRHRLLSGQNSSKGGVGAGPAVKRDSAFLRTTLPNGTTTTVWAHSSGAPQRVTVTPLTGTAETTTTTFNAAYQPILVDGPISGAINFWFGPELKQSTTFEGVFRAITSDVAYAKYAQVDSTVVLGALVSRNFFSADSLLPDSSWNRSSGTARFKFDSSGRVLRATSDASPTVVDSMAYESTYGNPRVHRRIVGGATYSRDSVVYDASGRPATTINALSQQTTHYYDKLNRDTLVIGPLGARAKKKIEDPQRRFTFTDAMNQVYVDSVNALGWVVRRRDPRGNSDTFGYDRLGNVVRRTNRNGQDLTFQFDSLNRVTRQVAGTDTTHFGYGFANMWVSARNAHSIDTLQLPGPYTTPKFTTVRGGNKFTVEIYQSPLNQPTTTIVTAVGGGWSRTASASYNAQQSVDAIADFGGNSSVVDYGADYRPQALNNPGGAANRQIFAYDSLSRFKLQTFGSGSPLSGALARSQYYDALDRVTLEGRTLYSRQVTYDSLGHFASASDSDPTVFRTFSYSYDSVGNRRDTGAQLATGNRLTRIDQYNITYDSTGNILMRAFRHTDTLRYTWNALGELTRVIRWRAGIGTDSTTYLYDGFGRRIRKTLNGSGVANYLYSGDQVVMELGSSYAPVAEYTYLPGIDLPHSMRKNSAMYYFVRDGQGNVIGMSTSAGAVAAKYDYTPYGELLYDSAAVSQPYRFKGRELDAEAGLYYVRARYYDPYLGRFISEDPVGLEGGVNPYAFAGSDPVNGSDPSGLDPFSGGGYWGKEDGCYYERDDNGIWTWWSWGDQQCVGPGRPRLDPRLNPFYIPPREDGGWGSGESEYLRQPEPYWGKFFVCFSEQPGIEIAVGMMGFELGNTKLFARRLNGPGRSGMTSIDHRFPRLPGANEKGGMIARITGRGAKMTGRLGLAGTVAFAAGGGYALGTAIRCLDEASSIASGIG